ncbi:hypothetical protein M5K25_012039 [Dendrobium thyrsiflorum]|uniref:DUF659 domain-containing protein n=1 Tax=Dendrobium thyrsiflorum TaxID=117978 RepID=A0ABD0VBN3_DENTH
MQELVISEIRKLLFPGILHLSPLQQLSPVFTSFAAEITCETHRMVEVRMKPHQVMGRTRHENIAIKLMVVPLGREQLAGSHKNVALCAKVLDNEREDIKTCMIKSEMSNLIHVLINNSYDALFLKSIDASDQVKGVKFISGMLDGVIKEIEENLVVQVITNNISAYKAIGWLSCATAKKSEGKEIRKIVLNDRIWQSVFYAINTTRSIVQVLRMKDIEKKFVMGFIYNIMNEAKKMIANNL